MCWFLKASNLCIFYHNCKGWSKHSSWSCWIPLVAWPGRGISGELTHLWILSWCHMDYLSFGSFQIVLWHRADILWWVFGYCPLSSYLGFLEPMLCAIWVVVTMEVVSHLCIWLIISYSYSLVKSIFFFKGLIIYCFFLFEDNLFLY